MERKIIFEKLKMDETDFTDNSIEMEDRWNLLTTAETTSKNQSSETIPYGPTALCAIHDEEALEDEEEEVQEEEMPTKHFCGISCCFTMWQVKRCDIEGGKERIIEFNVRVEMLRFATNASFFVIILLGIIATHASGTIPELTEIEKTYGNKNICLYFDFYPVPYFAPFLYNITICFATAYCYASIIRIWIAYSEKKITLWQRKFFNVCWVFLLFTVMLFSLSFAVQPQGDNPSTDFGKFCIKRDQIVQFGSDHEPVHPNMSKYVKKPK